MKYTKYLLEYSAVFNVLAFTSIAFLLTEVSQAEANLMPLYLLLMVVFISVKPLLLITNKMYTRLGQQSIHWLFESAVLCIIAGFQAVVPLTGAILLSLGVIQIVAFLLIAMHKVLKIEATQNKN
jgi:hypothetical protein